MTSRAIVVPTDFSDVSKIVFPHAASLARAWDAEIVLSHVIPPVVYPGVRSSYLADFPEFHARLRDGVLSELETLAEAFDGVRVRCDCRAGSVVEGITATATECDADLIATATHGAGGIQHAMLGSEVERLVRTSPTPVLTVSAREPHAEPLDFEAGLRRIVVPTDFSAMAMRALEAALPFAAPTTEITLLHVYEPPVYAVGPIGYSTFDHGELEAEQYGHAMQEMERLVEDLRERHEGKNLTGLVVSGVSAPQIVETAKDGVDLISMTTHGYGGLKHFTVGSIAERVLRLSNCPTLITRPEAEE